MVFKRKTRGFVDNFGIGEIASFCFSTNKVCFFKLKLDFTFQKFNAMITNKKICEKSMNGVLIAFDLNVVVFIAVVVVVVDVVV